MGLVTVISAFTTAAWAIRSWMARSDASLAEVKSSQEEVKSSQEEVKSSLAEVKSLRWRR